MRSTTILATLLSLAIASPITGNAAHQDECACDYMCPMQVGLDCKCEIEAKNNCYTAQRAAGLSCPAPIISEMCQPMSIQPVPSIPSSTSTATSTGNATATSAPAFAAAGEKCGSRGMKACGPDLTCVNKKPKCADCPGVCEAATPAPMFAVAGERCGSKGLLNCGPDLSCEGQKKGCADCPGVCSALPSKPTPTSLPTPSPTSAPAPLFAAAGERCGSKGLLNCGAGLVCANQKEGCADCPGVCEAKVEGKVCGGFAGLGCVEGECVIDEQCVKDGWSDCQGRCHPA
ncbi:hypothetical protein K505DRAFT_377905 [Melanomma pulvis-pyrius CBS 109.77]|uniref:IGFBP N-terminal domain-containing protein n=1 Tax=Melanomma pulvis-pyrius CBS 109.77 TaxID=1314802 RepID=A0A6A6X0L0_9PLEO|nr:hypothetical protein K505DRAFT_377905 [Melanomma pulvis-pyrius CBS 109.77]